MFASSAAWRRISRVLLPALALGIALLGQPALADSNPPNCGDNDQAPYCTEQVGWHNASIQHDPIVYLVFWGNEWEDTTNTDYTQAIAETNGFFDSLAGTAYNNILTQYYDGSGSVHNDVARGGWWIDDQDPIPSPLNLFGQFINVIARAAASNGWRLDANAQYLIYPQQHTNATLAPCGGHFNVPVSDSSGVQHQVAASYELYPTDFITPTTTCESQNTVADSLVVISAHEYAEAVTDPNGPLIPPASWGWSTDDPNGLSVGFDPIEVADKCQGYNSGTNAEAFVMKSDGTHFNIPPLWDRTAGTNGCVTMHGQDYNSPDNTFPFHGVHTVEDAIFTEYQGRTDLGAPLTEQMPINGGQVSYFAGNPCTSGYVIPSNTGYGGSGLTSGAAIYYSSATGAHEVDGCNFYKYWHDRGGPGGTQGFPTSDVLPISGGYVSYFAGNGCGSGTSGPDNSNSAIYSSNYGTDFVGGCIYRKYVNAPINGPGGGWGFPTSDVLAISGGYVAHFAKNVCASADPYNGGSAIYYGNNVGAAYEVHGCIYYTYWHNLGGPGGSLGFPTSDEYGVGNGGDRRSNFEHGTLTWIHATGQVLVYYYNSDQNNNCVDFSSDGNCDGLPADSCGDAYLVYGSQGPAVADIWGTDPVTGASVHFGWVELFWSPLCSSNFAVTFADTNNGSNAYVYAKVTRNNQNGTYTYYDIGQNNQMVIYTRIVYSPVHPDQACGYITLVLKNGHKLSDGSNPSASACTGWY